MVDRPQFSVIIVCLNAGKRLQKTLESVLKQSYEDYEIVIKDGLSEKGQTQNATQEAFATLQLPWQIEEKLRNRVHIYQESDQGIYDAMNQAIQYAKGQYYIFMNAGDDFHDSMVLEKIANVIKTRKEKKEPLPDLLYGKLYHKELQTEVCPAPSIDDFTCYRNVPCHQTCFYHRKLFEERGYDIRYNVRADYEHFLWCYYKAKAMMLYVPIMVADYEGGGYSETPQHRKESEKQHREIVIQYMGKRKANHYRRVMILTLAPLRSKIANNKKASVIYNEIKKIIYKIKK